MKSTLCVLYLQNLLYNLKLLLNFAILPFDILVPPKICYRHVTEIYVVCPTVGMNYIWYKHELQV